MNSTTIINPNNKTITFNRKNVKQSNKYDLNYLNITIGKSILINILLKKGYKIIVNCIQYESKEDKHLDNAMYRVSYEVSSFKRLGLRTESKNKNNQYYRFKVSKKNIKIQDIRTDLLKDGYFSNKTCINQLKSENIDINCKNNHTKRLFSNNSDIEKTNSKLIHKIVKIISYIKKKIKNLTFFNRKIQIFKSIFNYKNNPKSINNTKSQSKKAS